MRRIKAFSLALVMASFGSVMLAQAQPAPADPNAGTTTVVDHHERGTNLGWLGLLGLVGLLGLRRREPDTVVTTRTADATR
jgi:MYXO-CTERM domain-containing protein